MTIKKEKIIIGNLKMNGSLDFYSSYFNEIKDSLKNLSNVSIGLCIP